MNANGPAV